MNANKVTSIARARARKPSIPYSGKVLAEILSRIANGESLNRICSTDNMPTRKTFFAWVAKDRGIQARYEIAMMIRADVYADEIIEIADDSANDTYLDDSGTVRINHETIARSTLRVNTRKWYTSKLFPKKYGNAIRLVELKERQKQMHAAIIPNTDWESIATKIRTLHIGNGN